MKLPDGLVFRSRPGEITSADDVSLLPDAQFSKMLDPTIRAPT